MKAPAAALVFATAALAHALLENDGSVQKQRQHHSMPGFQNLAARAGRATGPEPESWKATPDSRMRLRKLTSGGIVQPGRVLSKRERQNIQAQRSDSLIDPVEAQEAAKRQEKFEQSFAGVGDKFVTSWRKFEERPVIQRIYRTIDTHWAPNACIHTSATLRDTRKPTTLRALIVFIILLLIVFGALYVVVEYLLLSTRATACSVSTVYLPFTITVTAEASNSSSTALVSPAIGSTSATEVHYTSTSTRTLTSFVTLGGPTTTPPYVYTVDPVGSTHWVNGVSPSDGVSLVTKTTSVFVTPAAATGHVTLDSTTLSVEYVTLPPYTSTEYTFVGPEVTVTSTSTSTSTVTYTLSYASPGSTDSRSAFAGISSAGWNASTSPASSPSSILASSVAPDAATYTSIYYTSSGLPTTSTTTTFLTTTISRRLTVTITPSSSEGSPETTAPSTSSPSAWPSTLSVISTTHNGTLVGPETASMTTVPVPSSFPTLLTTFASNSLSTYVTSGSSLISSMSASTVATASNSSAAGAITGSLSSTSSTALRNASVTSPMPNSGSSSGTPQITNTISHISSVSSSSVSAVSTWTSQSSGGGNGRSSSPTKTKPSASSNPSSSSSSVAPVSASSSSSKTNVQSSTKSTATTPSIYSTLSGASTGSRSSTAGPVSGSSSKSSLTSSPSLSSPSPRPSESPSSMISAESGSTKSHHHSSTHSPGSRSTSKSGGSSTTTAPKSSPSTSHGGITVPTSSSASKHGRPHASSASSSGSAIAGSSTPSTLHSYTRSASKTESSVSSTNPSATSSASATPTGGCGEHGTFLIDFDNLSNFTPTNQNTTDITQAPPIPNPYWHLTWSDGYVYAPQPPEPYKPVSPSHLAVFLADGAGKRIGTSPSGNYSKPGEISDGPREAISAFWFDAYSAWFGCDNHGPDDCTLIFSAYSWSPNASTEVLIDKTTTAIAPCMKSRDCDLEQVEFPVTFQGLSGLQIQAFVGKEERMFFMDDLLLHWTNNTCAAGLLRQSSL